MKVLICKENRQTDGQGSQSLPSTSPRLAAVESFTHLPTPLPFPTGPHIKSFYFTWREEKRGEEGGSVKGKETERKALQSTKDGLFPPLSFISPFRSIPPWRLVK